VLRFGENLRNKKNVFVLLLFDWFVF
jgi:hypothetical protein